MIMKKKKTFFFFFLRLQVTFKKSMLFHFRLLSSNSLAFAIEVCVCVCDCMVWGKGVHGNATPVSLRVNNPFLYFKKDKVWLQISL